MSEPSPSNPLTQLPARDEVAAIAATGGDADLARELLETLLEGLPREVEDLRATVARADWPALADLAHQVRGASRYCGVPALDEAIELLQRATRSGDAAAIAEAFAGVEAESLRLKAEAG